MAQKENDEFSQIDDFIDACNESGQYDVLCNSVKQPIARYVYSAPGSQFQLEKQDNISLQTVEGGSGSCYNSIGSTDSEITIVRVKRENFNAKPSRPNNWELMHDSAIPGDGTHLGESPSLVNLVTFVVPQEDPKNNQREYMIPLSSWEPAQARKAADRDEKNEVAYSNLAKSNASTDYGCLSTSNETMRSNKSTTSIRELLSKMAFWKTKSPKRGKK